MANPSSPRRIAVPALAGVALAALACSAPGSPNLVRGSSGGSSSSGGSAGSVTGGGAGGASAGGSGGTGIDIDIDAGLGGSGGTGPQLMTDVSVIITADNAYGFGYGSGSAILNYFGGVENQASGDIFDCPVGSGPESYTVPAADANVGSYLYIVGYADKSTTQGVIAMFFREGGAPVYTGNGQWQGCATGEDYDPGSGGPSVTRINEFIELCNAGAMDPQTTSVGWVDVTGTASGRVVFGEDNTTERDDPEVGNEFLIACDIDDAARWMWFEWEPDRTDDSAFLWPGGDDNTTKDFLIFRLGAEYVPQPPH
jgi:hypothetical protein